MKEPRSAVAMTRAVVAAVVLPAAIAAVGALMVWSWRAELPSRVAIHWGLEGQADDFADAEAVAALVGGFGAGFAVVGLALVLAAGRDAAAHRLAAGVTAGTTAFVTVLVVLLTADQRGLPDAAEARASVGAVVVALAFAGAVAVVAVLLAPPPTGKPASPVDVPAMTVEEGERIAWTRSVAAGSAVSVVLVVVVGVTSAAAVVSRQWWALAVAAGALLLMLALSSIVVTVAPRGVTIRSRFGWPRSHTPLEDIRRAGVTQVSPIRDFGGYGYRVAVLGPLRGATGFVLRGGEALVVERSSGRRLVVVVDDAVTAASLLNALVSRRG